MDKFDIAYVVTNDTDFVDAIKMVVETIQKSREGNARLNECGVFPLRVFY